MQESELEQLVKILPINIPEYNNPVTIINSKIIYPEWIEKVWPKQYDFCNIKITYVK